MTKDMKAKEAKDAKEVKKEVDVIKEEKEKDAKKNRSLGSEVREGAALSACPCL
jgi:hypothetical protein